MKLLSRYIKLIEEKELPFFKESLHIKLPDFVF